MTFYLGIDPSGGRRDPLALAVCETHTTYWLSGVVKERFTNVSHLEKHRGLSFEKQLAAVAQLTEKLHFTDPLIAIDSTGVGSALTDALRARGVPNIVSIQWTGGQAESFHRIPMSAGHINAHVSKSKLFQGLASAVFSGDVRVASRHPLAKDLLGEFADVETKISASGAQSFDVEGRGHHGDLTAAVAMCLWAASLPRPPRAGHFDASVLGRNRGL